MNELTPFMNGPFRIGTKQMDHTLYLVNDNAVSGNEVFGALLLYFVAYMQPNDVIQIMKRAERNGETPFMISTEKECNRALDFFKTLKIPVRMKKNDPKINL